jgi:hypothetical protein
VGVEVTDDPKRPAVEQFVLDELIAGLEAAIARVGDITVPLGFTHPHSYRGYYRDLAFEPARNVPLSAMLSDARGALGATYQGWKGGDFTMHRYTDCWLAYEGHGAGETLGRLLFSMMLGER